MRRLGRLEGVAAPGADPKEERTRALVWTVLGIAAISAATPAPAQTYDPNYPICLQTYSIGGGYIACGYTSLAQCQLSASGRAAQCIANPFFRAGTDGSNLSARLLS